MRLGDSVAEPGLSALEGARSGLLGPGSLGTLLSYCSLDTYYELRAYIDFKLNFHSDYFSDPFIRQSGTKAYRFVQGTGLGVGRREDLQALTDVTWKFRDVQDLPKALKRDLELEATPVSSKFPAIFTTSFLPPASSFWAPEMGQGECEGHLRLWVCVEDSGPGMIDVGLEWRGLAPPGAGLRAERAGFIPAHQQPLIPLTSFSQGLPGEAVTSLMGQMP